MFEWRCICDVSDAYKWIVYFLLLSISILLTFYFENDKLFLHKNCMKTTCNLGHLICTFIMIIITCDYHINIAISWIQLFLLSTDIFYSEVFHSHIHNTYTLHTLLFRWSLMQIYSRNLKKKLICDNSMFIKWFCCQLSWLSR